MKVPPLMEQHGVLTTDTSTPDVLKIALVGEPFATVTTSEFQVHVLLSEDVKKDGLKKDGLDVGDATVKSVTKLASPSDATLIALVGRDDGASGCGCGCEYVRQLAGWQGASVSCDADDKGTRRKNCYHQG